MNRAEITREQTNKQRQIIEYHRATMAVFSEINKSVSNGEYKSVCTIPSPCLEHIVSNLREEGFIVEKLKMVDLDMRKILIHW